MEFNLTQNATHRAPAHRSPVVNGLQEAADEIGAMTSGSARVHRPHLALSSPAWRRPAVPLPPFADVRIVAWATPILSKEWV
jgi:hypothetical protein